MTENQTFSCSQFRFRLCFCHELRPWFNLGCRLYLHSWIPNKSGTHYSRCPKSKKMVAGVLALIETVCFPLKLPRLVAKNALNHFLSIFQTWIIGILGCLKSGQVQFLEIYCTWIQKQNHRRHFRIWISPYSTLSQSIATVFLKRIQLNNNFESFFPND